MAEQQQQQPDQGRKFVNLREDLRGNAPYEVRENYKVTLVDLRTIEIEVAQEETSGTRGGGAHTRSLSVSFDAEKNKWTLQLPEGDEFTSFDWGCGTFWDNPDEVANGSTPFNLPEETLNKLENAGYGIKTERFGIRWTSTQETEGSYIWFSQDKRRPGIVLHCKDVQILDGKASKSQPTGGITLRKPIIYAYAPQEGTQVSIGFGGDVEQRLIEEDPKRSEDGKWHFTTGPDGTLRMRDGGLAEFLFWEATRDKPYPFGDLECLYVAGESTLFDGEIGAALKIMGLNEKETADFMDYWRKYFEEDKFYRVQFLTHKYADEHPLVIEPTPVSVFRIFMIYEEISLDAWCAGFSKGKPICWRVPIWNRPATNEGLIIVEWGGAYMDEARETKKKEPFAGAFVVLPQRGLYNTCDDDNGSESDRNGSYIMPFFTGNAATSRNVGMFDLTDPRLDFRSLYPSGASADGYGDTESPIYYDDSDEDDDVGELADDVVTQEMVQEMGAYFRMMEAKFAALVVKSWATNFESWNVKDGVERIDSAFKSPREKLNLERGQQRRVYSIDQLFGIRQKALPWSLEEIKAEKGLLDGVFSNFDKQVSTWVYTGPVMYEHIGRRFWIVHSGGIVGGPEELFHVMAKVIVTLQEPFKLYFEDVYRKVTTGQANSKTIRLPKPISQMF